MRKRAFSRAQAPSTPKIITAIRIHTLDENASTPEAFLVVGDHIRDLKMRVSRYSLSQLLDGAIEMGLHGQCGGEHLSCAGIKFYSDATSSRMQRREDALDSIEVGQRADFAALDQDQYATPIPELAGVKAKETWIGGERDYAR